MMFVILCYDVEQKRLSRMRKTAKKYLFPAQRSVFEGNLTEYALGRLQEEIAAIVDPGRDAVTIYCCNNASQMYKRQLGLSGGTDDSSFL